MSCEHSDRSVFVVVVVEVEVDVIVIWFGAL